jgi:hypothetical protein
MSWQNLFIYAFPPFSVIGKVLQKIEHEAIEAIVIVPYWTTQSWFNKFMNLLIDCHFFLPRKCISHPVKEFGDTPTENEVIGWQIIRKFYEGKYFSSGTINILLSSWKEATSRQYHICLLKWCTYCWERNINPFSPCLSEDLSLLTLLFSTGIGYSALNTARSALSTFIVCDNLPNGNYI